MTRSKIQAMFREFPFLRNFFNPENIYEIKISRVDEETLDLHPEDYDRVNPLWVKLLDEEGREVTTLGSTKPIPICRKWYNPSTWKGRVSYWETVSDALLRLGEEAERVTYVLKASDSTSIRSSICLYKSPKGFSIRKWLDEIRRRDAAEAKAIRAKIDQIE